MLTTIIIIPIITITSNTIKRRRKRIKSWEWNLNTGRWYSSSQHKISGVKGQHTSPPQHLQSRSPCVPESASPTLNLPLAASSENDWLQAMLRAAISSIIGTIFVPYKAQFKPAIFPTALTTTKTHPSRPPWRHFAGWPGCRVVPHNLSISLFPPVMCHIHISTEPQPFLFSSLQRWG